MHLVPISFQRPLSKQLRRLSHIATASTVAGTVVGTAMETEIGTTTTTMTTQIRTCRSSSSQPSFCQTKRILNTPQDRPTMAKIYQRSNVLFVERRVTTPINVQANKKGIQTFSSPIPKTLTTAIETMHFMQSEALLLQMRVQECVTNRFSSRQMR